MSHKQMRFQVTSKLIRPNNWITQTVRQRIPNCWARNGESPSAESAATDAWNDELTATGGSQMLATRNRGDRHACSNRRGTTGLAVPDNGGPSPPACTAPAEEHPASADRRAVAVTDHGVRQQATGVLAIYTRHVGTMQPSGWWLANSATQLLQ